MEGDKNENTNPECGHNDTNNLLFDCGLCSFNKGGDDIVLSDRSQGHVQVCSGAVAYLSIWLAISCSNVKSQKQNAT